MSALAVARYDLLVVGAGPAGLTGAMTAESEGINTLMLEADRIGGQAGMSTMIKNYPGFPDGIRGDDLMEQMNRQATNFTADSLAPVRAEGIVRTEEGLVVQTDSGEDFLGRAVLVSCGVQYRLLKARNAASWLGRGVMYGSPTKAEYSDKQVAVVGGANSAGQAAVYLSRFDSCMVHMLVRGQSIGEKMSSYLVEEITTLDNIKVHTDTQLEAVDGKDGRLTQATISTGGTERDMQMDEIFIMIGAIPKTRWLGEVQRDARGYVSAGSDLSAESRATFMETTEGRQPLPHETSMPGLFVAGDVRQGSNKRVASAVGDGTNTVPDLHRYLESAA